MIWGRRILANLATDADVEADWRDDEWKRGHTWPLLESLLLRLVTGREKVPPDLRIPPVKVGGVRTATEGAIERACLKWLVHGGPLRIEDHVDIESDLSNLSVDSPPSTRQALLTASWLLREEEGPLRSRILSLLPTPAERGELVETLFLTLPAAQDTWRKDAQARAGWAYQVARFAPGLASLLALGIYHCQRAGLEPIRTLTDALAAIDDDLYAAQTKARVSVGKLEPALTKSPRTGLEIDLSIHGGGGQISAGLPMVLEDAAWGVTPYVLHLLAREAPLKEVRGARSKKDVLERLSHKDSHITAKIRLSHGLSIDEADLGAYRLRQEAGMEWVRGCFPRVKATANLVVA